MTFVLRVDAQRWRANLRRVLAEQDDPATGGRLVPVAKSNGYGLGQGLVAREVADRPVLSVGTVFEALDPELAWPADLLVLTPYSAADPRAAAAWEAARRRYGERLIATVADPATLRALAGAREPSRVLLEGLTSLRRFGLTEAELLTALAEPLGPVRLEGLALHLPMVESESGGKLAEALRWAQFWLARFEDPGAAGQVWVSHLPAGELAQLRAALPGVPVHPRVGTALWLGDAESLAPRGVVLAVHGSGSAGYFQHRVPAGTHLVVVGGGTSHGVALSAPIGAATLKRRVSVLGEGVLDAAGRAVSPFRWQGRRLRFLESPHASVSLVLVGKGVAPPRVGDELHCQIRLTTARFDAVLGLEDH